MLLTAPHFSTYGVGYRAPLAYADTVNHCAKADINFAASRGQLNEIGATTFSPDNTIMRGMFVTALGRLMGDRRQMVLFLPGRCDGCQYQNRQLRGRSGRSQERRISETKRGTSHDGRLTAKTDGGNGNTAHNSITTKGGSWDYPTSAFYNRTIRGRRTTCIYKL